MKKEVTVLEDAKGTEVKVGCDRTACEGCSGSFFCTAKDSSFDAFIDRQIELKKGDKVIIDMPSGKTLTSIFMSLGLPLIMFLPGYFIGKHLSHGSDGWALVGALLSVALGFGIGFVYFRKKKKDFMPRIEEKKE